MPKSTFLRASWFCRLDDGGLQDVFTEREDHKPFKSANSIWQGNVLLTLPDNVPLVFHKTTRDLYVDQRFSTRDLCSCHKRCCDQKYVCRFSWVFDMLLGVPLRTNMDYGTLTATVVKGSCPEGQYPIGIAARGTCLGLVDFRVRSLSPRFSLDNGLLDWQSWSPRFVNYYLWCNVSEKQILLEDKGCIVYFDNEVNQMGFKLTAEHSFDFGGQLYSPRCRQQHLLRTDKINYNPSDWNDRLQ